MEKNLYIKWNNGRGGMVIHLDNFFPCTKSNLKKLLSTISLDWGHEVELVENLKVYFQEKMAEHEGLKKIDAEQHLYYRQKEADTKQIVTTKKRSNGVPLKKEELRAERENLGRYKMLARDHLSGYKQHEKMEKWFSETLKLL